MRTAGLVPPNPTDLRSPCRKLTLIRGLLARVRRSEVRLFLRRRAISDLLTPARRWGSNWDEVLRFE